MNIEMKISVGISGFQYNQCRCRLVKTSTSKRLGLFEVIAVRTQCGRPRTCILSANVQTFGLMEQKPCSRLEVRASDGSGMLSCLFVSAFPSSLFVLWSE